MLFFITFLFAFLSASIAYAGFLAPIFTFVGSVFAAGGLAGTILKGVLYVALSVGASLLQKALMKKPKTGAIGTSLSVDMGDDVPASFPVGYSATAGKRKYIGTWGKEGDTPNAFLTDVIEYSSLPSLGQPTIWVGEQKATLLLAQPHADGRGYPVLEYRRGGEDYLWVKWYDGTQTTADAFLRAKFGGSERPYKANMIGRGCAYAIFTCRFEKDIFGGGLPQWLIEPNSIPLYDIRKDSSVGGSGPQRWSDKSTWQPSDNPAVIIYNIIRGITYNDKWFYGGQNIGAHRLPASNWIAAANACDQLIDGQKAYRAGSNIDIDVEPIDLIEEFAKGCNARIAEVGGFFKISVGAPPASSFGITDNDIVVTKNQDLDPFPSLDQTYNGIEANYPEPQERWANKNAPSRFMPDLESADGNRRLPANVDFPTVPFGYQVQRLMDAMIKEYRRFRIHRIVLPPASYVLEPNDVISWTSVRNGYVNKKFVIISVEGDNTLCQLLTIKEVDPSDYDWKPSDKLPTDIGWVGVITPPAQVVTGWTVTPDAIVDSNGKQRRPAIRVSCNPDQEGVTHVWVQARNKSNGQLVFDSDSLVYESPYTWLLDSPLILNNEDYQVRGRFVSLINPNQNWTEWFEVKTFDIKLDIYDDVDIGEIEDLIPELDEWIGWNTREEIERARKNILLDIDQDAANFLDKQQVRKEVTSSFGQSDARWAFAIDVATGPNSAIVRQLTDLTVKVNEDIAEAVDILQTQITQVNGQAQANSLAITNLTTQVNNVESSVTIRGEAQASPGGGWARYGIQVRSGTSSNWSTASFYMDTQTGGTSRVVFVADQFVIQNNTGTNVKPFVFQGNTAYMENANIGTVKFNQLESNNGKLIMRGYGNFADIRMWT